MSVEDDGRSSSLRMNMYMGWTDVVTPENWAWEEQFRVTTLLTPDNVLAGSKRSFSGRPANDNKRRKLEHGDKPTRLRVNKQVKTWIPSDVWRQILVHANPLTLFSAQYVNKELRALLQYEGTWRQCRKNYYDADIPDPPAGLRESQYVDLLEGKGCMSCKNLSARRTYWAFLRRWCGACFKEKTIRHESAKFVTGKGWLLDAIPCATIDSWGSYEGPGKEAIKQSRPGSPRSQVYLREDVTRIVNEYEERFGDRLRGVSADVEDCDDEEKRTWREEKKADLAMRTQQLVAIEDWDIKRAKKSSQVRKNVKEERVAFFRAKAAALDPPLSESALDLISAYQRAVKIARPPSDKAWMELLPKLERDRDIAEERDRANKMAKEAASRHSECVSLTQYRSSAASEAEAFLSKVADKALQALGKLHAGLNSQDYVLMALKYIWRLYHVIPCNRRPKVPAEHAWFHTDGVFRLSLFDALVVLEAKILPAVDQRFSTAEAKAARNFKCPGCTRSDIRKAWPCRLLFAHIQDRHAQELNGFQLFSTPALSSQTWHAIEWPHNLPMLADHHQPTGSWDPNDTSAYKRAPSLPIANQNGVSAFEGRLASPFVQTCDGHSVIQKPSDFVSSFTLASALLRRTNLSQDYQSLVALRFALDLYNTTFADPQTAAYPSPAATPPRYPTPPISYVHPTGIDLPTPKPSSSYTRRPCNHATPSIPPFSVLENLVLTLIRAGDYKSLSNLRCKVCMEDGEHRYTRLHTMGNTGHPLGELVAHFGTFHSEQKEKWATELFALPSEEELGWLLKQSGMESASDVFGRLFPVVNGGVE